VVYKGADLDCGFRADLVIEDDLILELKSVTEITAVHQAQILTYLRLSRRSLGLLINFNVPILKEGIRRVVAGSIFESA
jgi:GxxExxY protein